MAEDVALVPVEGRRAKRADASMQSASRREPSNERGLCRGRELVCSGNKVDPSDVLLVVVMSAMAAIILEMDRVRPKGRLSPACQNHLAYLAGLSAEKCRNLEADRDQLAGVEDKFVFEIAALRELAKCIGFGGFEVIQHSAVDDLGASLLANLHEEARGAPGATDGLEHYRFVFEMVTEKYGRAMRRTASHGFAFFLLVK